MLVSHGRMTIAAQAANVLLTPTPSMAAMGRLQALGLWHGQHADGRRHSSQYRADGDVTHQPQVGTEDWHADPTPA